MHQAAEIVAALRNPAITVTEAEITQIEALLASRRSLAQSLLVSSFAPGDRVTFTPRKGGGLVIGTVRKVNRTTVSVTAADQVRWKVSPSYLTKVGGPIGTAKHGAGA